MKCLQKQTFNGCNTPWVCYPLRYLMAGLSAENMINTLEDENEKLRAEIEELEASKNKTDMADSRESVIDVFTGRMPLHARSLPRHAVLDKVYASFSFWPGHPEYPTDGTSNAHGDIRGDISAIHEDDWTERRLAFRHMYGLEYEDIKDTIVHHSDKLDLLVDMCNIRGTVQVRLHRSEPEDREDMQRIRGVCDQVIRKWDGRSTEYWNTPEIEALIDELNEGLGGWVVVSPTET